MKEKIILDKEMHEQKLSFHPGSFNSLNKFNNPNKTISNFISSFEFLNNELKAKYKSSFVLRSAINDYVSKSKNNQRLFTISNSTLIFPFKVKENISNDSEVKICKFKTRLIKQIKFNIGNNNRNKKINKNKMEPKLDFIKKKILNKIKDSNFLTIKKSPKNKNTNSYKFYGYNTINRFKFPEYNTMRYSYTNNTNYKNNPNITINHNKDKKNKYLIKIVKNSFDKAKMDNNNLNNKSNIKAEAKEFKIYNNKNNYKKLRLNIKDENYFESKKNEKFINGLNKLKGSENKNTKRNKEIPYLDGISKNELKIITKKNTFMKKDISLNLNNFLNSNILNEERDDNINCNKKKYYPYLITQGKALNKKKTIIRNNQKDISNLFLDKNYSNNNTNFDLPSSKKEHINFDTIKSTKNKIEDNKINCRKSKNISNIRLKNNKNQTNITSKKDVSKNLKEGKNKKLDYFKDKTYNINKYNKKKENYFNYEKKEKKKQNKIYEEEIIDLFDIESEHKKVINSIKTNDFDVNKPKENNMKYTLLKEFEDEEENLNINKSQIENIIIGNIEGYKDIIESDKLKLNKSFQIRSKSSFDMHKQINKKLNKKDKNNKNKKKDKSLSNNKTSFVSMHILEDNSSEIEDLNFYINDYRINDQFLDIENEYEFEDMPTYENETKIKNENNLLPFHVSKISFCKCYDNKDGQYKTNENIDTDIISLIQINKELNNLNDNCQKNSHTVLKHNNELKNKNSKEIKNLKNNFNDNKTLKSIKNNKKKDICKKQLVNNINKFYDYRNNLKKCKYSIFNKNHSKKVQKKKCNNIKKKINKNINCNEKAKLKKTIIQQNESEINKKSKNKNFKIVSNYGSKDNCLIF